MSKTSQTSELFNFTYDCEVHGHLWNVLKLAQPSPNATYVTFYCQNCLVLKYQQYDGLNKVGG